MEDVFEKALAEQCAPTLAGVKAASLFRISGETGDLRRAALHWHTSAFMNRVSRSRS